MLARPQVEGLRTFFAGPHLELHFVAFAQVFELDLRPEPRAMKEHVIAAVVGRDEAESLVLQDLLDTAGHELNRGGYLRGLGIAGLHRSTASRPQLSSIPPSRRRSAVSAYVASSMQVAVRKARSFTKRS